MGSDGQVTINNMCTFRSVNTLSGNAACKQNKQFTSESGHRKGLRAPKRHKTST